MCHLSHTAKVMAQARLMGGAEINQTHGAAQLNITEQQADLFDNNLATAQTVRRMCTLIAESVQDPGVMRCLDQALTSSDTSRQRIAAACWEWCKQNIRFVQDDDALYADLGRRDELELLISPAVMARGRNRRGDCDDFTMMLCAMLASVGVPCVIKTFKCDRKDPSRWAHVCAAAILEDGSLMILDASHGDYPGWQVPQEDIFDSCVWNLNGQPMNGGTGMGIARRGIGAYRQMPGWTGNPMSSVTGPEAGPYTPAIDIRQYYQAKCNQRMAGLGFIKRRGMGALVCDDAGCYDDGTSSGGSPVEATPYFSIAPGTSYTTSPSAAAASPGTVLLPSTTTSGQPINWGSLIASLGADATKIGTQLISTPGTTILPNGTVVTGTPQGTSALTLGGLNISSGMLIGAAALIGLVLLTKK